MKSKTYILCISFIYIMSLYRGTGNPLCCPPASRKAWGRDGGVLVLSVCNVTSDENQKRYHDVRGDIRNSMV